MCERCSITRMNNCLKIAYVGSVRNHFVAPYLGAMSDRGHQVTLYNIDSGISENVESEFHVVDVSCGVDARNAWTKWRYALSALRLRDELRRSRADIVHSLYASSAGVVCLLANIKPYIVSVRGSDLLVRSESFVWRQMLRRVLGKSILVHAVSEELAESARSLLVADSVPVRVLTQGVSVDRFTYQPRRAVRNTLQILCTRRFAPIYSNHTIVDACALLRDRGVPFHLTFAANGPLEKNLIAYVERLGLSDKVDFLGGYSNSALPDMMKEYDVYVSASLSDGTSVSLLEAMSGGLFPIVSRITANRIWIDDGRTGYLFESGNQRDLADSLSKVAVLDANMRRLATDSNRKLVEERANQTTNMDLLEEWYRELIG